MYLHKKARETDVETISTQTNTDTLQSSKFKNTRTRHEPAKQSTFFSLVFWILLMPVVYMCYQYERKASPTRPGPASILFTWLDDLLDDKANAEVMLM